MCVYLRRKKVVEKHAICRFCGYSEREFFCNRKISLKRIKQNVHSAYDFLPPMPNCGGVLISIFLNIFFLNSSLRGKQ